MMNKKIGQLSYLLPNEGIHGISIRRTMTELKYLSYSTKTNLKFKINAFLYFNDCCIIYVRWLNFHDHSKKKIIPSTS